MTDIVKDIYGLTYITSWIPDEERWEACVFELPDLVWFDSTEWDALEGVVNLTLEHLGKVSDKCFILV